MNHPVIHQARALIMAGEIAEAESQLVAIAEIEGDRALVSVLDEMAPKDVLAIMREFDASKESVINLVVSAEQFIEAVVLECKYGEPIDKYVPRLRNTMNAVMHRSAGTCAEVLEVVSEHKEGVRLLADYFTDYYDALQNFAFHGVFEVEVDVEKAFAPKRVNTWDAEQRDDLDQGMEMADVAELSRVRMSRSEVADADWMETAWVLRNEFTDTFELLIIEIQDRLSRLSEAVTTPRPDDASGPGTPRMDDSDDESAI